MVVVVVLVAEDSDVRGVRAVVPSVPGRVVGGRFAAAVVEAALGLAAVVFPGDALVPAIEDKVVLRAAGFLFSSPDVTEGNSGSASEAADLEAKPGFLATVPGAGRVGGLFRLDPAVDVRVADFDAVVGALAVVDDAVGRRAAAVPLVIAVGRRGGTGSLDVDEDAFEAILRRAVDEGVVGARGLFCVLGASAAAAGATASPVASLGASAMASLGAHNERKLSYGL